MARQAPSRARWRQSSVFAALTYTGFVPIHKVRRAIYRDIFGLTIAPTSHIYSGVEVRAPRSIVVGAHTIIGHNCILDGRGGLDIGDNVNLSSQVAIWTMQHDLRSPDFEGVKAAVRIGDYAWLSFRSTILPGVEVGKGAVVAAGAVVRRDVPPFAVVAGVPATVVGERPRNLRYTLGPGGPLL